MISKERGWSFYEKLRANDTMIVQGHQQASEMLSAASGSSPPGRRSLRRRGSQGRPHGGDAVSERRRLRHPGADLGREGRADPNAAKLLAEFIIGDAVQKIFPADGGFSARNDIPAPAGPPPLSSLKSCRRLRLHREGSPAHQEAIQRDILVIRFLLESAAPCSTIITRLDQAIPSGLSATTNVRYCTLPRLMDPRVKPGGDALSKWQRPKAAIRTAGFKPRHDAE